MRKVWFETSYLLDQKQTKNGKAKERFENFDKQALQFTFPSQFDGKLPVIPAGARPKAAIIREKGSNSEREMANAMFLAGFDVKDVHMTDLISGRETLEDIQFIGAVGGVGGGGGGSVLLYSRSNISVLSLSIHRYIEPEANDQSI